MKQMVDVTGKDKSLRVAKASVKIKANEKSVNLIKQGKLKKGNALETAKLAAINAVKKTPELILYAHPVQITSVNVEFKINKSEIEIVCEVKGYERTGFEMEALTGAVTSALNIYDMVKSIDREAIITDLQLIEKSGGKSGDFVRSKEKNSPPI